MEGILVLLLIFPGAFAFITCMALVDVKKALRAHRHSPLDGPTFDVLKRKKRRAEVMNEYFTRFVENLTKRTRAGELRWSVANANGLEKWLHADKSLCLFFCENFGQIFYISFGTKGREYVHEIVFKELLKNEFCIYLSLAASELDSGFELALRELVDVVRFGRFKQLFEATMNVLERRESK